ncbi:MULTISPECIES: hypothetical protein [unclassified Pseudonocardia]|jgi:hypothetical protein|uniref:hypothetical protein n=1 Tax=unclassified Pseudonocardia TaxID=2619320 RepID=UPI00095E240A|nr:MULTISPECIES: hypothetical protein [unclassified Pseudonocardia]MBN9100991.1 hypothetical protein [Pseudonocardia sp.]OJY39359.1 MAG: hypothetical protein BGP03_06040 [Pseudonocardia sp. 73-21]
MDENVLVATRRSLHAVAEHLLAGPQYRERGTIRLRASPGGLAQVQGPVRVDGTDLVVGEHRVPLAGTIAEVAAAAGLAAGVPEGLYGDHADWADGEELTVDPGAAGVLADWFDRGDAGLRAFAGASTEPVIWPEHFDLAVTVDEVNYGVSPGDTGHQEPYAYVGPWTLREGPFWNAAFGALRGAAELPDAAAVAAFFTAGRAAAG